MPANVIRSTRRLSEAFAEIATEIPKDEIPSEDALALSLTALADVHEYVLEPIMAAMASVRAADEEATRLPAEAVGRLILWASDARMYLDTLREEVAKVAVLAVEFNGPGLPFDEKGWVTDHERFEELKRENGYA